MEKLHSAVYARLDCWGDDRSMYPLASQECQSPAEHSKWRDRCISQNIVLAQKLDRADYVALRNAMAFPVA